MLFIIVGTLRWSASICLSFWIGSLDATKRTCSLSKLCNVSEPLCILVRLSLFEECCALRNWRFWIPV